jgi:hypothetical protein
MAFSVASANRWPSADAASMARRSLGASRSVRARTTL